MRQIARSILSVVTGLGMVAVLGTSTVAAVTQVTTCGQVVTGRGVLASDLDCSTYAGDAVVLERGSKLDLAGFTLTADLAGVRCRSGYCKVVGPGTIRRLSFDPLLHPGAWQGLGVRTWGTSVVKNVTFENWNWAVYGLGPTLVRGCTFTNGGGGAIAGPLTVVDSTFTGNRGFGAHAYEGSYRDNLNILHYIFYKLTVRRSTFSGNGIDLRSYRRPLVVGTTCTTSEELTIPVAPYGGGDEWGVCS